MRLEQLRPTLNWLYAVGVALGNMSLHRSRHVAEKIGFQSRPIKILSVAHP
jgi:hypothetical protein